MASTYYDFNQEAREIYSTIVNLELEKAEIDLRHAYENQQGNGIFHLLDNYRQVLEIFTLDKESLFEDYRKYTKARLKILKKGDEKSPWHKYCPAEILLQGSILEYKYGHWWRAFLNVKEAHRLLKKNQEEFPDFMPSYRSIGVIHAFMGTLPLSESMRWLVKQISGMSGSIEQGMQEIKKVLDHTSANDYIFADETRAVYAYILVHMKHDKESAWQQVRNMNGPQANSVLASFVRADIALSTGRLEKCLAILDQITNENAYQNLPFLYYMRAKAQLFLDLDEAETSLRTFLSQHQGESYHYAAWQKLAWYYLINGNEDAYLECIGKCKKDKPTIMVGEDKEAQQEAIRGQIPDWCLLKARISYDGKQYEQGIDILNKIQINNLRKSDQVEYYYRKGRLTQGVRKLDVAIEWFEKAHDEGQGSSSYMVCNSALQIGLIYEILNQPVQAEIWLRKALNHRPDSYKFNLHQRAKTALKRLEMSTDK
jgi:tetratricopeptide (TPR) repeat protein